MSSALPLVSVAIRAYRRRWLSDAIKSVLAQTHRNLEIVVYDDAGDLQDVAMGFNDDRIRYYQATTRFQASGRFKAAVALCRGHYIGVLDDDDRYEPEFVATLLAALEQDARVGVAFCRTAWDSNGRIFFPADARPPGHQPQGGPSRRRKCSSAVPRSKMGSASSRCRTAWRLTCS